MRSLDSPIGFDGLPAITRRLVSPGVDPYALLGGYAATYNGLYWGRYDAGITLGGTPKAFGTSAPTVTISGTLAQFAALYIKIDGAGDETSATFRWSLDGGATFVQTARPVSGSPCVLGSTGLIATFPAGAYSVDNIYRGTAAVWADQGPAGNDPVGAATSVRPIVDVDGILFDGVNDGLAFPTSLSAPSGGSLFICANLLTEDNSLIFRNHERTFYAHVIGIPQWVASIGGWIISMQKPTPTQCILECIDRAANDVDIGINGVMVNRTNGAAYAASGIAVLGGDPVGGQVAHSKIREVLFLGAAVPSLVATAIREDMASRNGVIL
jgi:hypothetical protein